MEKVETELEDPLLDASVCPDPEISDKTPSE